MKRMIEEVERLLGRLTSPPDIIVVEDNRDDHMLIASVLGEYGCQIYTASDGGTAIDMLNKRVEKKDLPDLIFLDLQLPISPGLEVLRIARELMPSVPVVIVTGQMTRDGLAMVAKTGYVGFIEKPLTTDGLEQIFSSHRIPYRKTA